MLVFIHLESFSLFQFEFALMFGIKDLVWKFVFHGWPHNIMRFYLSEKDLRYFIHLWF